VNYFLKRMFFSCVNLSFWSFSFLQCVSQSRENHRLQKVPDNPLVTHIFRPVESVNYLIFRKFVGGRKGRLVEGVPELATLQGTWISCSSYPCSSSLDSTYICTGGGHMCRVPVKVSGSWGRGSTISAVRGYCGWGPSCTWLLCTWRRTFSCPGNL
jgi:hypothetical protein